LLIRRFSLEIYPTLTNEVEIVYEKRITPFGNGAKVDAPKKYIGNRVYVIVLKG